MNSHAHGARRASDELPALMVRDRASDELPALMVRDRASNELPRLMAMRILLVLVCGWIAAGPLSAQAAGSRTGGPPGERRPAERQEPLRPSDYGQFESPGPAALSPDGRWIAYIVNRVNEQSELRLRHVARDSVIAVPYGGSAVFSPDSRWLAYSIDVSPAERERLEEAETPIRRRAALQNLASGATVEMGEVSAFEFSPDGAYLALTGYATGDRRGSDLIIRDLARATNVNFGNVASFAWSTVGALLAFTIDTESGTGNAVQLYDAATGTLRVLDSSTFRYHGLAWREEARDLAVLRALPDSAYRDTAHIVIAWKDVNTTATERIEMQPRTTMGFPAGMRVSEAHRPAWTTDGSILTVGLRPQRPAGDSEAGVPADQLVRRPSDPSQRERGVETVVSDGRTSDVQVWHARDVRIIPQQRAQEQQDLRRTLLAAWHVTANRLVPIGTELLETARVLEDARHATETDESRNTFGTMFGRPGTDVWLIDVASGERTRVLENVPWYLGGSRTGRYLLWFVDGAYWTYDVHTRTAVNISAGTGAVFENEEFDYPVEAVPPYGVADWTRGDEMLLVHDRYDVWRLAPDGSGGRPLTGGRADRVVHRFANVQPDEEGIDLARAVYLSLFGERTKQSGWAM
ncbi:MAG: PD40 domain-containing protein, partial [Gemmatimonadetes bacterium]|nr:PD40 domain-containing protein [Gemmatimonadota bacterium]